MHFDTDEDRRRDLLAKAEEAEKQATLSLEPITRARWEEIAERYRKLANET